MGKQKDLIDFLGSYRARTIARPSQAHHYSVSTRAAQELPHWPALAAINGTKGRPVETSDRAFVERRGEPTFH